MKLIAITTLLIASTSLSYAGTTQNSLVWKDKGIIKQKVSLVDCKNPTDNGLNTLKEYRLFEIDSNAFWAYLKKTENQFATVRLPLPNGSTVPVKLDKNSPIQSEFPEVSRNFVSTVYIPHKAYLNGSLNELKQPTLLSRNISFEINLEGPSTTDTYYSVYTQPLKKPNTYAVYDSRNMFACPKPPRPLLRRY